MKPILGLIHAYINLLELREIQDQKTVKIIKEVYMH